MAEIRLMIYASLSMKNGQCQIDTLGFHFTFSFFILLCNRVVSGNVVW